MTTKKKKVVNHFADADKNAERRVMKMLCNPFYSILVDKIYCIDHEMIISKKEWIETNKKLIEDIGAEKWLEMLIENLEGDYITA